VLLWEQALQLSAPCATLSPESSHHLNYGLYAIWCINLNHVANKQTAKFSRLFKPSSACWTAIPVNVVRSAHSQQQLGFLSLS